MKQIRMVLCVLLGVMLVSTTMAMALKETPAQKTVMPKTMARSPIQIQLIKGGGKYKGKCPTTVKMSWKITNLMPQTMSIQYQFKRSDGAGSRMGNVLLRPRLSKTVSFSWTLNRSYKGWGQLIVIYGMKRLASRRVEFTVDCKEALIPRRAFKEYDPKLVGTPTPSRISDIQESRFSLLDLPMIRPNDLVTTETKILPRNNIRWFMPMKVFVKVRNHGVLKSPRCRISVTLKSAVKSPVTGRDTFRFEFNFAPLDIRTQRTMNIPFRNFWPCEWRVTVKVDSRNVINEGDSGEYDNHRSTKFTVTK